MHRPSTQTLHSATDLVNFLECEHLTTLDLINLDTPLPQAVDEEEARLAQAKGNLHEKRHLDELRRRKGTIAEIPAAGAGIDERVAATLEAMREGKDVIYQASLRDGVLIGHADFLRRVERPSNLGTYGYEVLDTKLARSARAKFVVQVAFYSMLLAKAQGTDPVAMHVVLGDGREVAFPYHDYAAYLRSLLGRYTGRVNGGRGDSYPDPCGRCDTCRWRLICEKRRLDDDHLSQVAGIMKLQVKRLQAAGIATMQALAGTDAANKVARIVPETLQRLVQQASLQAKARTSGGNHFEALPIPQGPPPRGFARLPRPDAGDLYFDMEGDPYEEGGLEYLFGLGYLEGGKPVFKPFWAHSRAEEKRAFEAFMDFVTERLRRFPGAHIYHYAHYEPHALKRLMSVHGTREAEFDNLLRGHRLVDLYKVVREALRISRPGYSLKEVEHFFLADRTDEIKSAGASIVAYERWKEERDPKILESIAEYNLQDVRSTAELHKWLLDKRPQDLAWAELVKVKKAPVVGEKTKAEIRLEPYREALVDRLPEDRAGWGPDDHLRELTYQLLDFHRRSDKPGWWATFARQEMEDDELREDGECLGGLTLDPETPPVRKGKSITYTCRVPVQESKLKTGDRAVICRTGKNVQGLAFDEERSIATFRISADAELVEPFALGPAGPIGSDKLVDAIYRFADSLLGHREPYPVIESLLRRSPPRVEGVAAGAAIGPDGTDLEQIIDAVHRLRDSCLFIQGPPGAGKTYTGAHVIVALLRSGKRVGVASNSHKAINKLLEEVEKVAVEQRLTFRGVKKYTKEGQQLDGQFIEDVNDNGAVVHGGHQLVAGTAWLFAEPGLDRKLDYLFVDEAGQVALANLVAMATSAHNVVLLGDQMQLGQPIQGVHPGRSGESSLEYLLDGLATIPPDRGIFLATSWRMHPDVCRFISDAVYDGRLEPEAGNVRRRLVLAPGAHAALRPSGVRYLPIEHDSCSQRSEEEAALVGELYESLLRQRYTDKEGVEHPVAAENILVVAPYNMQVNLLRRTLPDGARVGTVDKFQGQEAEVVIVSMATSSGEYLPRQIEFLYSKNRLNVALSRARCLSLLIANPALMAVRCTTPEQMALVNTLCWVRECSVARGA